MYLFEGLKEGDLSDLVLPLVSIDEYESKLDPDAIVFAFSVIEKGAARDLNRFIQKGSFELLDTDVSPAPNEDGQFMVFIEVLREEGAIDNFLTLLSSLKGLTSIESWKGQIYGVEGIHQIDEEYLKENLRLTPIDDEAEDSIEEQLVEFFRLSDLESITVDQKRVTLEGVKSSVDFEFVDMGNFESVRERQEIMSQGLRLDEAAQSNVSRLQRILGDLWMVEHLENHVLLSNILSEEVLLLKVL